MVALTIDLALGLGLIAVIGALARREARPRPDQLRSLGWLLVAIPLPAAVTLHLARAVPQSADQGLFLIGVLAFAAGSALLLGSEDEDDWRSERADDSPPWWPEFEREFREYERFSRTPRSLSRS